MGNTVEEYLFHLYEELDVAVMMISVDSGEILFFNQHVCGNMKKDATEIKGKHYRDVFEPDFSELYAGLVASCAVGDVCTKVFFWETKMIWEQISARKIAWLDGSLAVLLTITNITEVSRSEYELKQMAYYDQLLHLPNGQKLEDDLSRLSSFDRAALIHFDIRRFSAINDLYGWSTGDELLTKIRDWLLSTLRNTSKLYRTNDDEFCLFICDISQEQAEERAREILERFKQPWTLHYGKNTIEVYCRLVMGVVYGKFVRGDMRNILYRTTHAPIQKRAGYALYDEEMDAHLRKKVRLRHDLIHCIKGKMRGFEVYYQPIVDAKNNNRWIGAEALCRWTSPRGESIPPTVFIPEVEKLHLVGEMDAWVRQTALRQCMEWGLHRKTFYLDMNLSPLQPISDTFINDFLAMIDRLGYPKDKLSLEITESAQVNFSPDNLAGLSRLRDESITLALDDFGTGYSTLENLIKIPAKVLKTERLFIQSLENEPYFQYLMRVMVDIAHKVNMVLIAEGVETEAQCKLLRSYGVDYMQGYLFAKPLSTQEFGGMLHKYAG